MRQAVVIRGGQTFSWIVLFGFLLLVMPAFLDQAKAQGLVFSNDPKAGELSADGKRIQIVQRLLKKLGIYSGPATGDMTSDTRSALDKFARDNGIGAGAAVTDSLVQALRRAAWAIAAQQYRDTQDKFLAPNEMREAQTLLSNLGYLPGGIDGTFGPGTMSAIETFQDSQRISVDGLPTRTVLMNLKRAQKSKSIAFKSELRVLNWSDYIEPEVLESFEAATSTRVIYDTFGSIEEMQDKIKNVSEPYDVIFPSSGEILRLAEDGIIQEVNKSKLKNLSNLDPKILSYINALDPGNKHQIPYMWGTIGIASNKVALAKVGASGVVDSLSYIFDPNYAKRLTKCGVRILDSASDAVQFAMIYKGLDPATRNLDEIKKVDETLQAIKPWVRPISTNEYIDALATGKICVVLAFSGDAIQARSAAKQHTDVDYQIAKEGGLLWFDAVAITAAAKNVDGAHKFLDYLLEPKQAAAITNFVSYANANVNSAPFVNAELLKDSGIFPTPEIMRRLQVLPHTTPEMENQYKQIWSHFSQ